MCRHADAEGVVEFPIGQQARIGNIGDSGDGSEAIVAPTEAALTHWRASTPARSHRLLFGDRRRHRQAEAEIQTKRRSPTWPRHWRQASLSEAAVPFDTSRLPSRCYRIPMLKILRWGLAGIGFVIVAGFAAIIGAVDTYLVCLQYFA